jgi:hypothetical protein
LVPATLLQPKIGDIRMWGYHMDPCCRTKVKNSSSIRLDIAVHEGA